MDNPLEIYEKIGNILISIAPDEAVEVIMKGEVEAEDVGELCYEYVDKLGNRCLFDSPAKTDYDIFLLLLKLRGEFKSIHEDEWNSCTFTLNKSGKFNMEFSYDESDSIDS